MKRYRLFLLIALAAVLALAAFAPLAAAAKASRATDLTQVYGTVYGFGGVGRSYWTVPITNAGVYMVDPTDGVPNLMATTDAYAQFQFTINLKDPIFPEKKAEFFVSPVHYFRTTVWIHSSPEIAVDQKFMVEVLPTILTGTVTNKATGKPIAKAHVQILNWDVYTNSKGVYTIQVSLQPNTDYKVYCQKSGYKRIGMTVKSLPTDKGVVRTASFKLVKVK
jgi:hypothetical protein